MEGRERQLSRGRGKKENEDEARDVLAATQQACQSTPPVAVAPPFGGSDKAPEAPKARWRVDLMGPGTRHLFFWAVQGPRNRYRTTRLARMGLARK